MSLYIFQSLILGGVLVVLARRSGRFDSYQLLLAVVWTVAVIAIERIYGAEQTIFYSSDQVEQLRMLTKYLRDGPTFSLEAIIGNRYVVIIPVWLLKFFGIDPLLAFKFLQAVCLTYIYRLCVDFLTRQGVQIKLRHVVLFAGPLFIFLSTIGLRDLEIALCVTCFFLGRSPSLRLLALGLTILLRPHLAVALIFGWLVGVWLTRHPPRWRYLALVALTVGAFMAGGYGYALGIIFQQKLGYEAPTIFVQDAWWRVFANLVGLQFLTFGSDVVDMSITSLIILRFFFLDTFLIPLGFIFTLLNQYIRYSIMRIQVFVSFVFFLGLVAQTDFNSSRQNLPFFSTMGVLALLGILKSARQDLQEIAMTTQTNTR